jgi:assimilatory nitrate reductase catalytic subunit
MRGACSEAPDVALLHDIEQLLHLNGSDSLRYVDAKRGQLRSIRLQHNEAKQTKETQLNAFLIAGDTSAETWLKALLQTQASTQEYGRRLLMTGSKPPMPLLDVGTTVCSCVGVKDVTIREHLQLCKGDNAQRLVSLQDVLKCGTQCGSCVPQLRRMIQLTSYVSSTAEIS